MLKNYGRLIDSVNDSQGRPINLYLNIYNHIQKFHDRQELWVKYWKRTIQDIKPKKHNSTLLYEDKLENGERIQIRVALENGKYLIKTAIFTKGVIKTWKRIKK